MSSTPTLTTMMNHEELSQTLRKLQLHAMATQYVEIARVAEKEKRTYEQYLGLLSGLELNHKQQARIHALVKKAKFPLDKILEDFDWKSVSGITQKQASRLSQGEWVKKGSNVVLYGSFGVGKTHLAMGIGKALCTQHLKVAFFSTHDLIEKLQEAKKNLELAALSKRLDHFDLIICDELGYLPQTQEGADLFFQLISQRNERKSLMITTNLTYSEWDQVFLNPRSTQAAVDRIIHHCETFNVQAPSRRSEEAKKRNLKLTDTESSITQ